MPVVLTRFFIAAMLASGGAGIPVAAQAELGGPLSSVAVDSGRMAVRTSSVALAHYTRHQLTRPNGAIVREFTNADGAVFAVTWAGPGKPDLRTLLGRYFATFQQTSVSAARTRHALRHAPQIDRPDLQIQSEGHMGWFHGVAYVSSLAPAGFSTSDLPRQP